MPLLATLIKMLAGNHLAFIRALYSERIALKLAVVAVLAAAYVACVAGFTAFISPLLGSLFSSGLPGTVLGLAFPPIAGTIVMGLVSIWGCLLAKRYTASFVKYASS